VRERATPFLYAVADHPVAPSSVRRVAARRLRELREERADKLAVVAHPGADSGDGAAPRGGRPSARDAATVTKPVATSTADASHDAGAGGDATHTPDANQGPDANQAPDANADAQTDSIDCRRPDAPTATQRDDRWEHPALIDIFSRWTAARVIASCAPSSS
jgi:hypothetical protein